MGSRTGSDSVPSGREEALEESVGMTNSGTQSDVSGAQPSWSRSLSHPQNLSVKEVPEEELLLWL